MKMNKIVLLLALVFPLSTPASVIHVPADQPTIQAGINAASSGDVVVVANGTYTGSGNKNLDYFGKRITVRSQDGPTFCTIDCQGSGRGFYFHSGENLDSIVEGFTIKNGSAGDGGGIYCVNASPKIKYNTITNNSASTTGGGISCGENSHAWIVDNTITWNDCTTSFDGGGGIFCQEYVIIENNDIENNEAYYLGGGIYCTGYYKCALIRNNSIIDNRAMVYGGGIACLGSPRIIDNIISENEISGEGEGGVWWRRHLLYRFF